MILRNSNLFDIIRLRDASEVSGICDPNAHGIIQSHLLDRGSSLDPNEDITRAFLKDAQWARNLEKGQN